MTEEEKTHTAIMNALEKVCSESKTFVSPERKERIVNKIESRIASGEPGDVVFADETMFIKPNVAPKWRNSVKT